MEKKRVLNYLGNVGMAIITASLMVSPSLAVDPVEAANQAVSSEGGKEVAKRALNGALRVAKTRPAMSTANCMPCMYSCCWCCG